MLKRAAATLIAFAAVLALGLVLGLTARRGWLQGGELKILDTPTILTRVQGLSQLVTIKYVLEKVVVADDAKWYGENRVTLIAHGVAKAGIDLARLGPGDVRVDGRRITITLPPAAITDVYIDDSHTEVLDRVTAMTRVFDKNLEENARRQAVEDIRRAALEEGILPGASDRAKAVLTTLLFQMGFDDVVFNGGMKEMKN